MTTDAIRLIKPAVDRIAVTASAPTENCSAGGSGVVVVGTVVVLEKFPARVVDVSVVRNSVVTAVVVGGIVLIDEAAEEGGGSSPADSSDELLPLPLPLMCSDDDDDDENDEADDRSLEAAAEPPVSVRPAATGPPLGAVDAVLGAGVDGPDPRG